MGTIRRFEEIEAWQTAREITRDVYAISSNGTFARDFGLRDQMRRAAVSVMSNIAEGFESRTRGLFAQIYVAQDAGYLTGVQSAKMQDQCEKCSSQISRLLAYLMKERRQV